MGPTGIAGLPDTMVISERGTLTWSPDHSKIFVAIRQPDARPAPARRDTTVAEEPVGNVDVWHYKDKYIQSVQMVRAQQDRAARIRPPSCSHKRRSCRSPTSECRRVQITRDGAWGIGRDGEEYVDDWKPQLADYYRVNTTTGRAHAGVQGTLQRTLGLSADGRYFLYWKDAQRLGVRHREEHAREHHQGRAGELRQPRRGPRW